MPGALIVLDRSRRVTLWSRNTEELWGLRDDETRGRSYLDLDIGLPVDKLRDAVEAVLAQHSQWEHVTVSARSRTGKLLTTCEVTCLPLSDRPDGDRGALVMVDARSAEEPS